MTSDTISFPVCVANSEPEPLQAARRRPGLEARGCVRSSAARALQSFAAMKLMCGFTRGNSGRPRLNSVMF